VRASASTSADLNMTRKVAVEDEQCTMMVTAALVIRACDRSSRRMMSSSLLRATCTRLQTAVRSSTRYAYVYRRSYGWRNFKVYLHCIPRCVSLTHACSFVARRSLHPAAVPPLASQIKKQDKPLSEEQIAYVVHEVLLGLDYLQRSAKIHRDIKAANSQRTRRRSARENTRRADAQADST
jgi:hypothetical protein